MNALAERLPEITRTSTPLPDGNPRLHAIRQEQAAVCTDSQWIAGEIREALPV